MGHTVNPAGKADITMLDHGGETGHRPPDQQCQRRRAQDDDRQRRQGNHDQHFERVMPVGRGEIHVRIAVMHPVNAPQRANRMFQAVNSIGHQISP